MSEIYLREVQLKDFRTFGDFSLALPPGPGLTLLVGTNGLGKSNFFDGIEWCLTGTVRRFEQYVGRLEEAAYLTRRDAPAAAHQAYLQFTTGETLTRNARGGASEEAVASLLKQPEWTDIKNPAAYLAFTHFLGQASQLRFTSREQSEQWEALKGPSGIDRLEAIRTALRGRATMTAFRRRAEKETVVLQGAEQALSQMARTRRASCRAPLARCRGGGRTAVRDRGAAGRTRAGSAGRAASYAAFVQPIVRGSRAHHGGGAEGDPRPERARSNPSACRAPRSRCR